jgi:hypothetical protein
MEQRYTALRTIGTVYKILGIISGVITILAILGICAASVLGGAALGELESQLGGSYGMGGMFGGVFGGILLGFLAILYGGGISITLYAFGEGIYLLLALEENTRTTAQMLTQQAGIRQPPPGA